MSQRSSIIIAQFQKSSPTYFLKCKFAMEHQLLFRVIRASHANLRAFTWLVISGALSPPLSNDAIRHLCLTLGGEFPQIKFIDRSLRFIYDALRGFNHTHRVYEITHSD